MKSSRPSSAHWRSSKTRATVPVEAIRSNSVRHAANSSSRPPDGAASRPRRARTPRLDPAPLFRVGHVLLEHGGDRGTGGRLVVALGQSGPPPDHLAERPERDALAVRGRPSAMPPDALDHAVEVLLELPREAALADPRLADERHEPCPPLAARRVELLLEEAQLVGPADERWLERVRPAGAASFRDHPDGPECRHRAGLALQRRLAGRLEGDGLPGRLAGRLADEHRPRRCGGLEAARGVHEVAGDHPLADRADGHRRLAGQHARPGLERLRGGAALALERRDRVDDVQGGPDRPLRVVLVGDGRPPDGHDRVADELLDRPAVARRRSPRPRRSSG